MESIPEVFWYWIRERHSIWLKKEGGESPPWTSDPILQKYKFTNVFRENDRTSKWVADNWREPNKYDEHCWFAMAVAILVNLPVTLEEIGYPVPYDRERCIAVCTERKKKGLKTYSGAYIINSPQGVERAVRIFTQTLQPMWDKRKELHWRNFGTLRAWHEALTQQYGLGSFLAAQIIAASKYLPGLTDVPDWWTFAAPGPGSMRGLNRLLERDVDASWSPDEWYHCAYLLWDATKEELPPEIGHNLHMQDLQNCLCEFDKYMRAKLGQGRPKTLYKGGAVCEL